MSSIKVESVSPTTNDSEGDEPTSTSRERKKTASEPELVGVLPPKVDDDEDDEDDDDYVPSGRTVSGNFPKKVPKLKNKEVNKPEKEDKDHLKDDSVDNIPIIIIHVKDQNLEEENGQEVDIENETTKIEVESLEKQNSKKDSAGDDTEEYDDEDKFDDDIGKYYEKSRVSRVSFSGKKLEELAYMAAEKAPEVSRTEKRTSQWEELMRKFSEAHKEECNLRTVSLDIPRAPRSVKKFPTGSMYEGTWDLLGMSGFGTYTFPNGVVYVGDFEDGMFHGEGEMRYPEGAIMRGTWNKGHMMEKTLVFADGLEYNEDNWGYCRMPDRRFTVEYENGLQPSGKSYLTADQPTRDVPNGYYDTGDGFYDPKTKIIYSADDITSIVRSAGPLEAKWIVDNCRKSPDEAVGPRQELYEEWSEPQTNPEPPPPPAVATRSNRRETTFSDEPDYVSSLDDSPKDSDCATSSSSYDESYY